MTALKSISKTPAGVNIEPRNPTFELEKSLATDWVDNDPFLTAIFNAMSLSFPGGERNFIDSVRHYEDQITDEKLRSEIRGFYKQEGIHSREHRKYNKMLCEQRGYDLEALEGVYLKRIEQAKHSPHVTPIIMLASTVAAEHFTASFGENILTGRLLKNVDGPIGELWRWHALEELEHKAIAFDVSSFPWSPWECSLGAPRLCIRFRYIETKTLETSANNAYTALAKVKY
ncbi:MAG: metal-dependent hydrolase [Pseudomonadota bacterium]